MVLPCCPTDLEPWANGPAILARGQVTSWRGSTWGRRSARRRRSCQGRGRAGVRCCTWPSDPRTCASMAAGWGTPRRSSGGQTSRAGRTMQPSDVLQPGLHTASSCVPQCPRARPALRHACHVMLTRPLLVCNRAGCSTVRTTPLRGVGRALCTMGGGGAVCTPSTCHTTRARYGTPTVTSDGATVLYPNSGDRRVWARDPQTGAKKWASLPGLTKQCPGCKSDGSVCGALNEVGASARTRARVHVRVLFQCVCGRERPCESVCVCCVSVCV